MKIPENITDEEFNQIISQWSPPPPPQYRVYYNDTGRIVCYTMEDLPGNYIVISAEDYALCRYDARVDEGKLVYTHLQSHTFKLRKVAENTPGSVKTTKYDINIIVEDDETSVDWWAQKAYKLET